MCSFVRMTETGFGAVIWGWFAYEHGKTLVGGKLMSSFKTTSRMAAISLAFVAGLLAMTPGAALAQTNGSWLTDGGGTWSTGSSWSGGSAVGGVGSTGTFAKDLPSLGTYTIALDGNVTSGTLAFTDTNIATNNGTWAITPGTSGTMTFAVALGTPVINVTTPTTFAAFSTDINGSQGLRKIGAGTVFLSGNNTYTGVTEISAATIDILSTAGFGDTGSGNYTLLTGGRARIGWNGSTNEEFIINASNSNGAISFSSSQGSVVVTSTVAGQVTLNATARIDSGAGCAGTFASGDGITLNLQTNTGTFAGSGNVFMYRPIVGTGGASVIHNSNGGTLTMTAANTYTGSTAIMNNGTIQLGVGGTGGSLSTSSAIYLHTAAATLSVNRSNTVQQGVDFSGAAITANGGSTGNFTQAGSGTTILTAENAYKGATNVNAGKLLINGNQSAATGAVTVAAGATLGGSGTTGGAVTVNGGILSPGNSPGVLTVASVTLNFSTSLFEVNGTTRGTQYDGLDITGVNGVAYGGPLSLSFGNGSSFADNTTFDLFSFTGTPSGNFSSVTSTGYYAGTWTQAAGEWSLTTSEQKLTFTPSTGDLVIAVPEPSTLVLLSGLAVFGFFARRQRGTSG